jgi:D-alanyl-D-alanine carboxypeptidase (penicillin-binding protein 5/6)
VQKKGIRAASLAAALIFTLLFILTVLPVSSASSDDTPNISATSALLYDKTHGKYIVEKNAFAMVNTSTSAKITMGLLACEMLGDRLEERVTVTEEMIAEASGYRMNLKVGELIAIKDLLYGAICGSYNDAAYVLAHVCGTNSQGFVEMMNSRALELGAKNTKYVNPLGYPDNAAMITTAYDTLKIALAASENELYMEICSAVKHTVPATNKTDERQFYNRNHLVSSAANASYYNPKCKGMNAGYSGEAGGWSIVTLAHDDGADYICIVLGGKESADGSEIYAYDDVNTLVNNACKTYNNYTVFPAGAQLGTTKIPLTLGEASAYIAADDLIIYIPTEGNSSIYRSIELEKDLKAPLEAGTKIGKVTVTFNGEKIGECDILLKESCEANGVMVVIAALGAYTTSRAFAATLVCFAVLLVAVFVYRYLNRYNSRSKFKRHR